jgi:hypothetical protein
MEEGRVHGMKSIVGTDGARERVEGTVAHMYRVHYP